jgi:hypothetical protein
MNRIWIYQSKTPITSQQEAEISDALQGFVTRWAAHNVKLDARFEILYSHFILLSVNQEEVMASGCSIDDSVRFMQELDSRYNLSLFDRQQMAFVNDSGTIEVCGLNDIAALYQSGRLQDSTSVFNNLIQDARQIESSWKIPFKESGFVSFK